MCHRRVARRRLPSICLLALLISFTRLAASEPDLEFNVVSGYVESVDIDGSNGDRARHTEDQGQGGCRTVTLVSGGAAAVPRIAIHKTTGDSWIVWWTAGATDEVRYVVRDAGTGAWSAEAVLSESGENSRNPEVVHNGDEVWIAYEIAGAERSIAVVGIIDEPEPFGRTVVATTPYAGNIDTLIHSEAGHVWVTWIDSESEVGWSEYDHASEIWGATQFVTYAGSTVDSIRKAIRATVVGP